MLFTVMAAVHSVASQRILPVLRPILKIPSGSHFVALPNPRFRRSHAVVSSATAADDLDVIPVQSSNTTDQQDGVVAFGVTEREDGSNSAASQVGGFAFESGGAGDVVGGAGASGTAFNSSSTPILGGEDFDKQLDRAINAMIVLAAGTFAITKLLTIDHDYWHVCDLTPPSFCFLLL